MFCTRGGCACSKSQCEMGRARSSGSVSQPRGCPVWPGLLPPLCLWTWHWALHPHRGMCPHSQEVGGITSMTRRPGKDSWWLDSGARPRSEGTGQVSGAGAQQDQPVLWFSLRSLLTAPRVPHCAPFALWVLSHTSWEAVGWLRVSWQWCHRLCQCESCPELG